MHTLITRHFLRLVNSTRYLQRIRRGNTKKASEREEKLREGCGHHCTLQSFLFTAKLWVCESEGEKENTLPDFGEGEESAVHSFPLKSLFLLYSQVLSEAGADAGVRLNLCSADLDATARKTSILK